MRDVDRLCTYHHLKSYTGVLPGWDWLQDHEHDLDGWQPTFETVSDGVRHTMTIKNMSAIKEIAKSITK